MIFISTSWGFNRPQLPSLYEGVQEIICEKKITPKKLIKIPKGIYTGENYALR